MRINSRFLFLKIRGIRNKDFPKRIEVFILINLKDVVR
jgi:hypothetical protein